MAYVWLQAGYVRLQPSSHTVAGQIAMRDILGFYLDFESASTPRPLGEDTEDFYELFDRDDERQE